MRRYRTEYRLWALISGSQFAVVGIGILAGEGVRLANVGRLACEAVWFAGLCAVVGWPIHAAAVACGVRLGGRIEPPEAADYDDIASPAHGGRPVRPRERLPSDDDYTFNDFRKQLDNFQRMGFGHQIDRVPGMAGSNPDGADPDAALDRVRAMIDAMTADERAHPDRIDPAAASRIAAEAGTEPADVDDLVRRFGEVRVVMRRLAKLSVWERIKLVLGLSRFPPP
jgi:hypothetical protein